MPRTRPSLIVGGTLTLLNDLASAINVPYLHPLVTVALRIFDTVEAVKSNKKDAFELAAVIGETVLLVTERCSPEDITPEQQQDIERLQRTLDTIASFLADFCQRPLLFRYLNHAEDRDVLRKFSTKVSDVKLTYLFSSMLSSQRDQQLEDYPTFESDKLQSVRVKSLEGEHKWLEVAHLDGTRREVLVRRYLQTDEAKKVFLADVKAWRKLRHPNFSFLGASKIRSPIKFIVFDSANHVSAQELMRNTRSLETAFSVAISTVVDIIAACEHLDNLHMPTASLTSSTLSWDGHKVILNLPESILQPKPRGSISNKKTFWAFPTLVADDSEFKFESLSGLHDPSALVYKTLMGLQSFTSAKVHILQPIWEYLRRQPPTWEAWQDVHRLFSLIRERSIMSSAQSVFPSVNLLIQEYGAVCPHMGTKEPTDVPLYSIDIGDVGFFVSSDFRFVKISNLADEMRSNPMIGFAPAEVLYSDSFPWECSSETIDGHRVHEITTPSADIHVDLKSSITTSVHDRDDHSALSRVQQYFTARLPGLLKEYSLNLPPSVEMNLVTSVTACRHAGLDHTWNVENKECPICQEVSAGSQCNAYFYETSDSAGANMDDHWGFWSLGDNRSASRMIKEDGDHISARFRNVPVMKIECIITNC